jgi:hypothetical protein
LRNPTDDLAIFHTEDACCGSATGYLLRRIAYRAGAYAPGIDDALFGALHRPDTRTDDELAIVDPWPSVRSRRIHDAADSRSLALHWSGWA